MKFFRFWRRRREEPAASPAIAQDAPQASPFWKHMQAFAARARQKPAASGFDPMALFAPYQPAKGVLPSGQKLAMDDDVSGVMQWAAGTYGGVAYAEGQVFLGFPELSLMAQRPEYRLISETIATEMTRKWIRIKAKANTDKKDEQASTDWVGNPIENKDKQKADKIARIEDEFERLRIRDHFREIAVQDGFFGRSHLYLDTGDTDNPDELMTDLGNGRNSVSRAKVSTERPLKKIKVVEPVWTYPATYNANDPLKPDWYRPDIWFAMGKRVHRTRLLPFVSREVPDLLKPSYAFAGLSLSQMGKPYVDNWLDTRQGVQDIIKSFTTWVLKTNMQSAMSGLATGSAVLDAFYSRLDAFNATKTNRGVMAIDKEQEDFQNISAPLGSLDHLQAQAQEHMASVSRIPLVKLTGISPSGLNASSEGELRCFEDLIHSEQESLFGAHLTTVLDFVQLSLFGDVDPEIIYEFLPINELTEKEKAELRQIEAQTGSVLIETGVISQEEERKRVASDPDTPYAGLDPDDMPDLGMEQAMGLGGEGAGGMPHKGFGLGGLGGIKTEGGFTPHGQDEALGLDEFDPNQPRDPKTGEWTKGSGSKGRKKTKAELPSPELFAKYQSQKRETIKAIEGAIAAGLQADNEWARSTLSRLRKEISDSEERQKVVAGRSKAKAAKSKTEKAPAKPKAAKPRYAGESREVVTPDGKMKFQARPELVELADLVHAKGDLQPRRRDTAESKITARERAAQLDPERLKPSRESDSGAPVIDADGTILSGNGRVMSLREAYQDKTLKTGAAYKKSLGEGAKGMKQPVLVMRLPKDLTHEQKAEFADRSNRSRIEGMGAAARAKRDARAAGTDLIALYRGGDFTSAENKPFLHAFTSKVMTANERSQFSSQGKITKEGLDRLNGAVLAAAYEDTDALQIMLESTDDNVKAITSAMRDTAGRFAELKAEVKAGRVKPDMNVTAQIADTAKLVSSLRKRGIPPAEHFAQIDAFSMPDPVVESLVKAFYNESLTRAKSGNRVTNVLRFIADEAMKHQSGGFLPDETGPKDVIRSAESREAKEHGEGEVFTKGLDLTGGKAHGRPGARKIGGGRGRGKRS